MNTLDFQLLAINSKGITPRLWVRLQVCPSSWLLDHAVGDLQHPPAQSKDAAVPMETKGVNTDHKKIDVRMNLLFWGVQWILKT